MEIRNQKLKEIVDGLDKRIEQEHAEIKSVLEKINSPSLVEEVDSCPEIFKKWKTIHDHLSKEWGNDNKTILELVDLKNEIHNLMGSSNEKENPNLEPVIDDEETVKQRDHVESDLPDSSQANEEPSPQPGNDKADVLLDHFVYYPLMNIGYTNEPTVWNPDFNPMMYVERCFTVENSRVKINLIHPSKKLGLPELMYFSDSQNGDVIISIVSKVFNADEKARHGYKNHVVIVEKNLLRDKTISILSVVKAIMEFDETNPKPTGTIPPLVIPIENNKEFTYKTKLKGVTKFSLAATANHLTISKYNKVNFVIKTPSTQRTDNPLDRLLYTIYMIELFNVDCAIEDLSVISTQPKDWDVAKKFNLFVTKNRMSDSLMTINPSYWKWYKSSESGEFNKIPTNAEIYKKIEKCR